MIRRLARGVVRRLLTAAGLVRASELDRARREALAAERERASRAEAATVARLETRNAKLRSARERATSEHAALRTTLGLLRHYLIRLERMEAEVADRVALEQRVKRSQLAIAVRAARRRAVSPEAAANAARLAAVSPAYGAAVSGWRARDVPADIQRATVAGLRWSVPGSATRGSSSAKRAVGTWLPLDDLGTIRQFAVGGVMLDIGAGVGATAIPRVLLGDFIQAYVAEPDASTYLCLVGNTLDNHLEGRVLPDCVAIGGSPAGDVRSLTIDDWVERLGVAADDVRFVRIALQAWNLNVLEGAAHLLKRRHVVWQMEIAPVLLASDGPRLDALASAIARHFTNVKELGRYWVEPWRPASEAADVLRARAGQRVAANLLMNLPGADVRPRVSTS